MRFDVCVIGAGPGGYAAAMRAHDLGREVLLIEKGRVGGAGIHEGALSSKTFWHLSNDYAGASRSDRGFSTVELQVSYPEVMRYVRAAVDGRRALLCRQLEALSRPAENGGRVTVVRGHARFASPHTVEVTGDDGTVERYEASFFVIATGSRPRVPPNIPVDGDRIATSDHIERWPSFPKSLVIVGAGVIGCEYAAMFANFRKTRIFIIDRAPRILPFEDEDVASHIATNFESMGITIHKESQLQSIGVVGDEVEYVIRGPHGDETIRVDRALVSVGRIPNTGELSLENAGVQIDANHAVIVHDAQTTAPHIYAAGDATLDLALANVAELEGRHAIERMFDLSPRPIRYEALSSIMFLSPEVASVGLNEQQCREKGLAYRVAVIHHQLVNRAIAMRATDGFIKLLAAPDHRILGLRVVGPQASSCIQGIALLIDRGGLLEDLDTCVHPHPAITEGVQEAARLLLGRSLHKAGVFDEGLLRTGAFGLG
jgi:dihydrolipoamide dehydrogenase